MSFQLTKQMMDSYVLEKKQSSISLPTISFPKSILVEDSDTEDEDEPPPIPVPISHSIEKEVIIEKTYQKKKNVKFVPPRKKDTLFWCFYIMVYGFSQYEYPGNNSFENEKTEKFRLIEFLRKKENKDILKIHKIGKIKEDIEDDLASKERIGVKTFLALCYTHKLNVLFIHRRKCFQIHGGHPEDTYHVIHQYDPPHQNPHGLYKYAYESDATQEDRQQYLDPVQYHKWEVIDKVLKAISSYKVADLKQLCVQTNIEYEGKTKAEMYELILKSI